MAAANEESDRYFRKRLSQVDWNLMALLYHGWDVLMSEFAEPGIDLEKQLAIRSAAADLAVAIEDLRTLERLRAKAFLDDSKGF